MEYKINENLIIEAGSENEEFGLISFYHPLTFNPSINDEYIFLDDQDAHCYIIMGRLNLKLKHDPFRNIWTYCLT